MLPDDYNDQDGAEEAEWEVRNAIGECFLATATKFGYSSSNVHARSRFPRDDKWVAVGTIPDPESVGATTDEGRGRITRYFSVKHRGSKWALKKLTLRYDIVISFGFKDEIGNSGRGSHDQLVACSMRFGRYLTDNLNLGLDDRVTHTFLDMYDNEMLPLDKEGNAAEILYGRLEVVLESC